jgi:thiol:disulfide interchange protein
MQMAVLRLVAIVAGLMLVAGCASAPGASNPGISSEILAPPATHSPARPAAAATPSETATVTPLPALSAGFQADQNASADIASAITIAGREHREVLLDFGASWCPECRVLAGLFRSAQVKRLLSSDYVAVLVDVSTPSQNLNLVTRYIKPKTIGGIPNAYDIPLLVILASDGKAITNTNDVRTFLNNNTITASETAAYLVKWADATATTG